MPGTRKNNGRPPKHPGRPVQNRLNEAARAARIQKEREGLRIRIPPNTSPAHRGKNKTPHLKTATANKTPPPTPSPVYPASGPNSGNAPPSPPLKSRFSNGGRFTRRNI